ncbi:MAG TPA: amidohydrolase family protein [Anaerovoracaceae bacterium]|nr:amidohydrolase family protein [Anaerovoracaceae bacterium]
MFVLRNCRLVKELTEEYEAQYGDVLIEGQYIADIKPVGHVFGGDCEEIDLQGKTLIPGLFELHAHLYGYIYNPYELQAMTAGKITFGAYSFAKAYLEAGYTTVRDCGSSYNCVAAIRDAVNEGIIDGPRLIPCGLIITPTEQGNDTFKDLYSEADGPDEIRKACRRELQKGNDFIKLMVSGAFMNVGGDPGIQIAEFEEVKAAVDAAKRKGTYVSAHCHGTESIKTAIRAGVRTIEHGTFLDDEVIEMLKSRDDCYLVPTGAVGLYCLDESNQDVSPELLEQSKACAEIEIANINKAYRAGLKLGFGSDIDLQAFKAVPGYEFVARKEYYTFDDLDILLQATKYSAEITGIGDITGTIKAGKRADLAVVDGNPDEDIYVMTKPIVHVFREGKKIK